MKKIAFFNHKGGVSKTTTAFHVGWMLTKLGKRVMMVDADSQCDLTLAILGEDDYERFYRENPEQNIKHALQPAFYAQPTAIKAMECIITPDNENLLLMPGSFDISEYEVQLGVSFQLANSFGTMKNLPGAFNFLIEKTAQEYDVDLVLIDLNPSLSAINQNLVINSDYFIIPTAPDYFSMMAIKSLARILPKWEGWAKNARSFFQDATYPISLTTPKFLGYTINNFRPRSGQPTRGFREIIVRIAETVKNEFIPSIEKVGMLLENKAEADYCLGEIPDFNTLQAEYQKQHLPVFALASQNTGVVREKDEKAIANFEGIFRNISETILERISHENAAANI